jgi:hypothetical protein
MKSEEVSLYLFIKRKNIAGKIMRKMDDNAMEYFALKKS